MILSNVIILSFILAHFNFLILTYYTEHVPLNISAYSLNLLHCFTMWGVLPLITRLSPCFTMVSACFTSLSPWFTRVSPGITGCYLASLGVTLHHWLLPCIAGCYFACWMLPCITKVLLCITGCYLASMDVALHRWVLSCIPGVLTCISVCYLASLGVTLYHWVPCITACFLASLWSHFFYKCLNFLYCVFNFFLFSKFLFCQSLFFFIPVFVKILYSQFLNIKTHSWYI